jgi:hypothetical protein
MTMEQIAAARIARRERSSRSLTKERGVRWLIRVLVTGEEQRSRSALGE